MEVTIKDLNTLKLSPTLIIFLKTIYNNDNEYLTQLSFNVDIWQLAKHLEQSMIIKIVGDTRECKSFEIRKLSVLEYLNIKVENSITKAKEIFDYFIQISEKYTGKKSRLDFKTAKDFLKGRINQGITIDNSKLIIDRKFKEWYNTDYRKHLNFQTLLGTKHYNQYLQQLEVDFDDNTNDFNTVKA